MITTKQKTDAGIVKTELYGVYAEEHDITFVMQSLSVNDKLQSIECIGWYCGEPNDNDIKQNANRQMLATY